MKMKTILKVAGITIAALGTGGAGLLFGPAIAAAIGSAGLLGAASTGTAISTLSGAALTNASLATFGGGPLGTSVIAFGIAGGKTVVTVATGAVGAASTAVVAKLVDRK